MPFFARPFVFLQRLFPASGAGSVPTPNEVTDLVHLVHHLIRPDWINNVQMRREVTSATAVAADLSISVIEPDPGFIQIPMLWTVNQNSLSTVFVDASIVVTGSAQDVWGGWETLSRTLISQRVPSVVGGTSGSQLTALPALLPMTRGFQYRADFFNVGAATVCRSHYYYLNVPGDLIDLATLFSSRGMNANNLLQA